MVIFSTATRCCGIETAALALGAIVAGWAFS
jgi:hypothetical protein